MSTSDIPTNREKAAGSVQLPEQEPNNELIVSLFFHGIGQAKQIVERICGVNTATLLPEDGETSPTTDSIVEICGQLPPLSIYTLLTRGSIPDLQGRAMHEATSGGVTTEGLYHVTPIDENAAVKPTRLNLESVSTAEELLELIELPPKFYDLPPSEVFRSPYTPGKTRVDLSPLDIPTQLLQALGVEYEGVNVFSPDYNTFSMLTPLQKFILLLGPKAYFNIHTGVVFGLEPNMWMDLRMTDNPVEFFTALNERFNINLPESLEGKRVCSFDDHVWNYPGGAIANRMPTLYEAVSLTQEDIQAINQALSDPEQPAEFKAALVALLTLREELSNSLEGTALSLEEIRNTQNSLLQIAQSFPGSNREKLIYDYYINATLLTKFTDLDYVYFTRFNPEDAERLKSIAAQWGKSIEYETIPLFSRRNPGQQSATSFVTIFYKAE